MSLKSFQSQGRLRPHQTSAEEIQQLLRIVERDLEDASIEGLSLDRRFFIAYDAALTLATIPLYCAGHETHGLGHHWLTFSLVSQTMGESQREISDMPGFNAC